MRQWLLLIYILWSYVQCGSRRSVKRNAALDRFLPENSASKSPKNLTGSQN